ncbi:programmed cell death protein 2 [Phycomyces nitens]|nr:programmed cell death protein 2 [Phycomyces nitens]
MHEHEHEHEHDEPEAWVSQLGYAEDPETPLTADTFPSKSGGRPAWMNPEHVLTAEQATCGNCDQPMALLVQLYTPEDQPLEAFHRTVYVFCCQKGSCIKKDWRKSFKVYRSQLPRENPYWPPPGDESEDEDAMDTDFTPKSFKAPSLCVICGLAGTKQCGRCHSTHYCSRAHQLVDWNECKHKMFCGKTPDESVERLRNAQVFGEKEIVSEPEGKEVEELEEEKYRKKIQEAGTVEEVEDDVEYDDAPVDSKVSVDDTFLQFQLRLQLNPDQVLRYDRVEYDMPDREPLWVQKDQKPESIPACEKCGGVRTFEFQILSTILNFLAVSHTSEDSLDWGSLYIYTCKHNCALTDVFAAEYIWKQDFSADGMRLGGEAPPKKR